MKIFSLAALISLLFLNNEAYYLTPDTSGRDEKSASKNIIRTTFKVDVFIEEGKIHSVIDVGTPPQRLKAYFELAFSDTWVASTGCENSCPARLRKFDFKKSTSFEYYGDKISNDDFAGITAYETFNMGDGLKLGNQGFVLFTTQSTAASSYNTTIFMGLGFSADTSLKATKFPALVENARKQNKIAAKIFSFWLAGSSYFSTNKGELMIGGSDSTRYSGFKLKNLVILPLRIEFRLSFNGKTNVIQKCFENIYY